MIVLDANLLLYAYDTESVQHRDAKAFLEKIFSAPEPVGVPTQSITAFLRIMTHQSLRIGRLTLQEAVEIVEEWLGLPQVRLLVPGERHWSTFRQMLLDGHASGRLVTDAEIAAITIEFGGVLQTNDRDFSRFPGLRWHNPLTKG
jgi:toxin-antitoxin system PIN domain toxin